MSIWRWTFASIQQQKLGFPRGKWQYKWKSAWALCCKVSSGGLLCNKEKLVSARGRWCLMLPLLTSFSPDTLLPVYSHHPHSFPWTYWFFIAYRKPSLWLTVKVLSPTRLFLNVEQLWLLGIVIKKHSFYFLNMQGPNAWVVWSNQHIPTAQTPRSRNYHSCYVLVKVSKKSYPTHNKWVSCVSCGPLWMTCFIGFCNYYI